MEAKIEKMQEMFKKDIEKLKNKQTEMNNTITEMKTTLEGINSRITEAEQISDLEDRMVEFTAAEQNKEKRMKRNKDSLRDLSDNIKCNNIHIIGVPEREERKSPCEPERWAARALPAAGRTRPVPADVPHSAAPALRV